VKGNYERFWHKKTVLVTGGAGAIGANLVHRLVKDGAEKVLVLDDLSEGFRWRLPSRSNIEFHRGSIIDEDKLKQIFRKRPIIIFHLAAIFANQRSIDCPEADLLVNGLGTFKVLQYAARFKARRTIYAASSSSHAEPSRSFSVGSNLQTPYQMTKLLGEFYCDFFARYHDLPIVKPCLFNSYGRGDVPGRYRNVITNFIYLALRGKALPITGTGEETRDFTFVDDHVDGLVRSAFVDKAVNSTFDLGTGVETRMVDLATTINQLTNNKAGIKLIPTRGWDSTKRRVAAVERTKELIGYEPSISLREGLTRTINWFQENWQKIDRLARSRFASER
jgi:UDP-glucose 4-epimerase